MIVLDETWKQSYIEPRLVKCHFCKVLFFSPLKLVPAMGFRCELCKPTIANALS